MSKTRTVPVVDRTARKLTIAAGLLWLGAVLGVVWMLTRGNPNTTWDWLTLALTVAAAVGTSFNAVSVHRDSTAAASSKTDDR